MTGKLIKNDLKSGLSAVGKIYFAAAIAIAAVLFSSLFKVSQGMKFVLSAAVLGIALVVVIVTFVQIIFGVNKQLFGREGYLTQTLPVRTSSMIFSKWFTASFWVLLAYGLFAVTAFLVYYYWSKQDSADVQMYALIEQLIETMGFGATAMYKKYLIVSLIVAIFNSCIFVMFAIFAITLSNIKPFSKLGSFGVIIYLAVVLIGIQLACYGLANICDVTMLISPAGKISMAITESAIDACVGSGGMTIGFTSVYFKAIITVFIYILTVQLNDTKINLK